MTNNEDANVGSSLGMMITTSNSTTEQNENVSTTPVVVGNTENVTHSSNDGFDPNGVNTTTNYGGSALVMSSPSSQQQQDEIETNQNESTTRALSSPNGLFPSPAGSQTSMNKRRGSQISDASAQADVISGSGSGAGKSPSQSDNNNKNVRWSQVDNPTTGSGNKQRNKSTDQAEVASSIGESMADSAKKGIWTRMARKTSVWEDDTGDNGEEYAMVHCIQNTWTEIKVSIQIKLRILKHHPHIPIMTVLCFLALATAGIIITKAYAQQYGQQQQTLALSTAGEYGKWFADRLSQAELPLFALSQFITEVPGFDTLPLQIGKAGEVGSAVFTTPVHRDVYDICRNTTLVEPFERIAKKIKDSSNEESDIVNLQYAPFGVVCLLYPLINYEDFEDGKYLNNTGAIGLDLLVDTAQRAVAEDTVRTGNLVFAGPITLRQCPDCDPVVRQAFIARLPVDTPEDGGITFDLNGNIYNWWGFSTGLINWGAMVDRSGMVEDFERRNQEFVLKRTDKLYDVTTGKYFEQLTTILQSENAYTAKRYANATLSVTNNDWVMSVSYDTAWSAPFVPGAIIATLCISVLISIMLMEILVERQAHKNLIKEMLPKRAMRKIQRGEVVAESYNIATIFFSDIIGYTTMSAEMRPIKVMKLLNSFYTEVDKIAEKHGVYKIETIGDAYMCVGGCPDRCLGPEGAEKVALFALDMIELVKNFRTDDGSRILVRAGINSGPVVAGVVGTTRPQFTIFGDAVNAASRMEATSKEMKIQCSDFTYRLLRDAPNFAFIMKERGQIQVKGKGHMNTWWIEGVTDALITNDSFSGVSTNPFLHGTTTNGAGSGIQQHHYDEQSPIAPPLPIPQRHHHEMEKSPSTVSGDSNDRV